MATATSTTFSTMVRQKPSPEHLKALYDLINEIMPDLDVYYTPEELNELTNKEGTELL